MKRLSILAFAVISGVFLAMLSVSLGHAEAYRLPTDQTRIPAVNAAGERIQIFRSTVVENGGYLDHLPAEIMKIDDSTVNFVSPTFVTVPSVFDLCFNVTVDSPDLEYMDRFDVDLPDDWSVSNVYTTPPSGCGTTYSHICLPIPSGTAVIISDGTADCGGLIKSIVFSLSSQSRQTGWRIFTGH